jgi:hypothetical protein
VANHASGPRSAAICHTTALPDCGGRRGRTGTTAASSSPSPPSPSPTTSAAPGPRCSRHHQRGRRSFTD